MARRPLLAGLNPVGRGTAVIYIISVKFIFMPLVLTCLFENREWRYIGMIYRHSLVFKKTGINDKTQAWKTYVAPLVQSYNASRHDCTGYSPFFLKFGR